MKKIGIITARGGSKRIPDKNIRDFLGKPIIAYSIEAALESNCFDEVMVSTDSTKIADIAREYGVSIPFMRSEKNSDDYSTTADVIEEVLMEYKKQNKRFDVFACIYPTAPFVTKDKLKDAMEKWENSPSDALVSVVKYSFPPQRGFVIKDDNVEYQYEQYRFTRSQDLEPIYHDCGQFYICLSDMFLQHHTLILPNTLPYIVDEMQVQDIDSETDWKIAEVKYGLMISNHTNQGTKD